MSDFFGNLRNPRMPEIVMNQGPLPPLSTDGMPYGLNGTADAKINYNNALLGGISPYSYGDAARITTQTSYVNIPYRMQKIVPEIFLPPMADGQGMIRVSHAVDYGDIAWSLRLRNISATLGVFMKSTEGVSDNGTHITAFVNLPTVNYILVGFQSLWHKVDQWGAANGAYRGTDSDRMWLQLWYDLFGYTGQPDGFGDWKERAGGPVALSMQIMLLVTPFGVCAGSEKQGGMHEVGLSPVMWAVNHVTSMNIDGLTQDMINYWKYMDISSGDKLCFRMSSFRLGGKTVESTLNHFYKKIVSVKYRPAGHSEGTDEENRYFVVIPDVFPYRYRTVGMGEIDRIPIHWFIGTTQQQYPKLYETAEEMSCFLDDRVFLKGSLLETTITPMLRNMDMLIGENFGSGGGSAGRGYVKEDGGDDRWVDSTTTRLKTDEYEDILDTYSTRSKLKTDGLFSLLGGKYGRAKMAPFRLSNTAKIGQKRAGGLPFLLPPAPKKARARAVAPSTAATVDSVVEMETVSQPITPEPVVPEVLSSGKVAKQVAKPVGGGKAKKADVV